MFDPIGAWECIHFGEISQMLGHRESYVLAAKLLDDLDTVEDWGCGMGYAKQFFRQANYIGVDGSKTKWSDEVDNVATRKSSPRGILMRHVLEHNENWKEILQNAVRCAQKRLVLVVFTGLTPETITGHRDARGIPCHNFCPEDIECEFSGLKFVRCSVKTDTLWVVDK